MRLLSVDIQGFKSFAKKVHISFRPGITGVIGPNGSGKSNVAEAIRWVLGEQSVKALRAKERSDVIYKGHSSGALKAIVTLTFDNEQGRFPLQAAQISITRLLTLQGESQYAINNEPVRLIDLQQMLAEAGIGTKSYTVISQGTVDRYLTATPQARKELFDEATGIKSLQIKLNASRQKLEKTRLHAQEVQAIIQELTPRVTFLKRQIDRYALREKYEAEFRAKQTVWYHHAWQNAQHELHTLQEEQQGLVSTIEKTRKKRVSLETETFHIIQNAQAYEVAAHAYARWEQEHSNLETLLNQVRQDIIKTEGLLTTEKRSALPYDTWEEAAQAVLRSCNTLIVALLAGSSWDTEKLKELQHTITIALSGSHTNSSEITKLKQKLAQLSAIAQERERQLSSLIQPDKPQSEEKSSVASKNTLVRELEKIREEEIQTQRQDSALASAIGQLQTDISLLEQEILRECGTAALEHINSSVPETTTIPSDNELRSLSQKISSIGEKDPLVIKEYEEANARLEALQIQISDIEATMRDIEQGIEEVLLQMNHNFKENFALIQRSFSAYFTQLFGGGTAQLEVLEDGVDILVTPPNKRARHIGLLSGGERTLTSLALLFAILDVQQPPFIVLDEVDAALDEANSKRFATLLSSRSHATQSIVISHNRETMAAADILYGVTMHADGTSHLYSVALADIQSTQEGVLKMPV